MQQIENYNFDGLCAENFCSKRYTHYRIIELEGMKIIIALCEKHAEKYLDKLFETKPQVEQQQR